MNKQTTSHNLVLTFQVPSESEGIEILSHSIVGLNLPRSARDFLYRVNHPYESRTDVGLNLNRLATWSVGKEQLIKIQIKQDGSQVQETISEVPMVIRLDLDINTDQTVHLGADLERLRNLLNELKAIALNVAFGGEANMRE
jgi:23S rRNA pseudoU1915 N3-methylase RlmH